MSLSNARTVTATEANRSPGAVFAAAEKGERVLILKNNAVQAVAIGLADYSKLEDADGAPLVVHTDSASMARHLLPRQADTTEPWTLEDALMGGSASDYDQNPLWNARIPSVDLVPGHLPSGYDDPDDDPNHPLSLNLVDVIHGGAGPTGLVVGAPGTGRSTLMRNIAVSLAILNSPQQVKLILLDSGAPSTFSPIRSLPHTLMYANTSNLRYRAVILLDRELDRRTELFEATKTSSVHDYNAWCRQHGRDADVLPHLVILTDDVGSAFLKGPLATVTKDSFRFGLHLVYAQAVEPGLSSLATPVSLSESGFTIALRLSSESQSKALLNVPDAAHLPVGGPGNAMVKFVAPTGETMRARFTAFGPGSTSWAALADSLASRAEAPFVRGLWNFADDRSRVLPDNGPQAQVQPDGTVDIPLAWVDDLSAVVRGEFSGHNAEGEGTNQRALNFAAHFSPASPVLTFFHEEDPIEAIFPAMRAMVHASGREYSPSELLWVWAAHQSASPWKGHEVPGNVLDLAQDPASDMPFRSEFFTALRDFVDQQKHFGKTFEDTPRIILVMHNRKMYSNWLPPHLTSVLHEVASSNKDLRVGFVVLEDMSTSSKPDLDFSTRAFHRSIPDSHRSIAQLGDRKTPGSFLVPGSPWEHIPWSVPDSEKSAHTGPGALEVVKSFTQRFSPPTPRL